MKDSMKIKILLLITLPPPLHGVTKINSEIANSIPLRETFDIHILPISYNKEIITLERFHLRKFLIYLKVFFLLVKKIILFRPHAVYFPLALHGLNFYRDAVLAFIIKVFGKKLILQLNGVGIEEQIKCSLSKFVYRQVFKDTYIICPSKALLEDLNRISDVIKKVYFVHFGIPSGTHPRKHKTAQGPITFINVSNIIPLKGQIYILKAIQQLAFQNYTNFKVIQVGQIQNKEYFSELEAFVRQNRLANFICFKGPLFDEERDRELASADIFLFPTLREAFGLVAIEAMKQGLPIIASDIVSLREIVGKEAGFLFPPKDDARLAQRMIHFLKNQELIHTMGEKAFNRFQNMFVFGKFEERMKEVFLDIIQKKPLD